MSGTLRNDLRGRRFGRLVVREIASVEPDGHTQYACDCDCGTQGFISRGTRLTAGRTVSCGCWRAEPAIRQAARLLVPARKRKAIAHMGGEALRLSRATKE